MIVIQQTYRPVPGSSENEKAGFDFQGANFRTQVSHGLVNILTIEEVGLDVRTTNLIQWNLRSLPDEALVLALPDSTAESAEEAGDTITSEG